MFDNFDEKAFWEAIKLPLRIFVFAALGFLVDYLVQYFAGLNTPLGLIVSTILVAVDKYLHEARASESKKTLEGFDRGLLPF